jgi:hypothetical protein
MGRMDVGYVLLNEGQVTDSRHVCRANLSQPAQFLACKSCWSQPIAEPLVVVFDAQLEFVDLEEYWACFLAYLMTHRQKSWVFEVVDDKGSVGQQRMLVYHNSQFVR